MPSEPTYKPLCPDAWCVPPSPLMLENGNDYYTCSICGEPCKVVDLKTEMTKPEQAGLQFQFQDNLDHVRLIRKDGTTVSVSILIWETANKVIGPNVKHFDYCDLLNEYYKSWHNKEDVDCSCAAREVNESKAQQRQALSKLLGRGEEIDGFLNTSSVPDVGEDQ